MNHCLIPVMSYPEIIMQSGKGSYLFDTSGKKYLDFNSGQFCTILGHSNVNLEKKINKANLNLLHTSTGLLSEAVINASLLINTLSGSLNAYSIFLSTGAEVIEFCLRYAKHITKKNGIVCFDCGYHGLSLGAQSITFAGKYATPTVSNVYTIPVANRVFSKRCIDNILFRTDRLLQENEIAAIVVEPVVSVGGMIFLSEYFLHELRCICTKYKVLLIFDECQTGFCRLGEWFAYQKYDVIPDMVATAKGVGLGYPVSLALFNGELIKYMDFSMTHYSSHQNDAFAANIVLAGIDFITKRKILTKVKQKGKYFLKALQRLTEKNKYLLNPRGQGLMLGVNLKEIHGVDSRVIYNVLAQELLENGIIIQGTDRGRVLRFLPDYLITQEDIDFGLHCLSECINGIYKAYDK
ncbi:aspartate aminotransferase family protein [Treponema sp. OMZ 840]|uniref:class-III pyridoxal-phosphate-dependent aminotransferase n=1 Tax=Treponema sp. OMZ 840 TaxID=244313 RepID=UPI003D91FE46